MTQYNGVYVASEVSQTVAVAGPLIELQLPASNYRIEILRAWIGAAEGAAPVDEIQPVELYINDVPSTSGAALTEQELRGNGDANSGVPALGGGTIGATPVTVIPDAFHLQNGWLYLPVPEERLSVQAGASNDNVGIRFASAPEVSIVITYGIIWGEVS